MNNSNNSDMIKFHGLPVPMPNQIVKQEFDFYISYNDHNNSFYGCVTTAIVLLKQEQPWKFYVLNGDHRAQLKDKDSAGCLAYFVDNIHLVNKYSERVVNGKFVPRRFRGRFSEKGLDDGGVASFVFQVDQLVKDKIYYEQDPVSLERNPVGVVIDDNGCWWHFGCKSFNDRFELINGNEKI